MAATRCFPKILYNVFKKLQTGNCVKVSSASSPEYFFFYKLSLMTSSNISRFGISGLAQFLLCCVTDPWCCKSSFPFRRAFFQSLYHVSRKGDFSFPCVCVCVCVCLCIVCLCVSLCPFTVKSSSVWTSGNAMEQISNVMLKSLFSSPSLFIATLEWSNETF